MEMLLGAGPCFKEEEKREKKREKRKGEGVGSNLHKGFSREASRRQPSPGGHKVFRGERRGGCGLGLNNRSGSARLGTGKHLGIAMGQVGGGLGWNVPAPDPRTLHPA
uniref:Uncharacterized protein n=1 Tax=Oryza glumipatula TaxID=40148 RepID=A0A0D9Y9B6_9ORYZ